MDWFRPTAAELETFSAGILPKGCRTARAQLRSPGGTRVPRELVPAERRAHQLDRDRVLAQHRVVELALAHRAGGDELLVQRAELETADHVAALVERGVAAADVAPHLARGARDLVADALDQEVDHLLWRHLAQVEAQGDEDPRGAVHAPEQHPDAVLGAPGPAEVPLEPLPVQGPALH